MSNFITIARPYANAAFNFALEHQKIKVWQEMLEFAAIVSQDQQFSELLSIAITPDTLTKIFIDICNDRLDKHGQTFIHIMAKNKRLLLLPIVLRQFMELQASLKDTIEVGVLSSSILSNAHQLKIITAMEKMLLRKVKLNVSIDKSVLAGVIIRTGDMVIDGSVRNRIERLIDVLQH